MSRGTPRPVHEALLGRLFFVSGFAAILYQLAWQRTLFAAIGINVEAVTLVVTAFIVGLGLGSVVGGALSRTKPEYLLRRFALIELGIGVFGACSLPLFRHLGTLTLGFSPYGVALAVFGMVLPPTIGMGAALPLLTTHAVATSGKVGATLGTLYYLNTLGSAVAAFASTLVLMRVGGLSGVVAVGVLCNVAVATTVLVLQRRTGAQ